MASIRRITLFLLLAFSFIGLCMNFVFSAENEMKSVALARPSQEQAAWHDFELGMFIHFAPNTWQDQEYDDLSTPLEKINPSQLDTDQWVQTAESMGAKYIIFVAKHAGGFCMWQTDTTEYGIKNTPWCNGKGDVLADLSASCRKRGIKLGVYLSPQDSKFGAKVGGKCSTPEKQKQYIELYRKQLTEVLSRYGEMVEVWFDGSLEFDVGDILKKYAPHAIQFQGKYASIRWVGNEDGVAPYPAWNSVSEADGRSGVATAAQGNPAGTAWLPLECDARMRSGWFWNSKNASTLKTVEQLMEMYYRSVGHGAVLLLNNTPDTTGLIPEADVKRSAEFGAEIRKRFGKSVAEFSGQGRIFELTWKEPTVIDHIITMEDILQGERVRKYILEAWNDNQWKPVAEGSSIGHKKIDRIQPIETTKVRFRSMESAAEPILRKFAVYSTGINKN